MLTRINVICCCCCWFSFFLKTTHCIWGKYSSDADVVCWRVCVCVCGSQTNTSHTERDTRRTQCIHSIPAEQHVSFVFHSSSVPFCYWHRYLKNEKWRKNAFTHTSRRRVTQVLTFNYWLLLKYWLAYFAFVKLHRRLRGMMSPQIVKAKSTVPFSLMTYLQMCK